MPRSGSQLRLVTREATRTHCSYCAFQCGMAIKRQVAASASLSIEADRNEPLREDPLQALCQLPGGGAPANADDRLICNCHRVSERALREAIASGADSLEDLAESTKAGTGCGSCKGELDQLIGSLVNKPPPALQAVAH